MIIDIIVILTFYLIFYSIDKVSIFKIITYVDVA